MLNAFAGTALQFGFYRTALGFGEAPNFPGLQQGGSGMVSSRSAGHDDGVVNFGTNLAQIVGPPIFIAIALTFGWRACFAVMGALGFIWCRSGCSCIACQHERPALPS